MMNPEDYPWCLDCWRHPDPDVEHDIPANQAGNHRRQALEEEANRLWAARAANGFRCLILYRYEGDGWEEVARWE